MNQIALAKHSLKSRSLFSPDLTTAATLPPPRSHLSLSSHPKGTHNPHPPPHMNSHARLPHSPVCAVPLY